MRFNFQLLEKAALEDILLQLFKILHGNMSLIAPTGGTFEEDFAVWREYIVPALQEERRQMVLMLCGDELAGYFQYDICNDVFMMEEIQIKPEYQGTGLFRELYCWLGDKIPGDVTYVQAYSNKENLKSQGILERLGLRRIGESKSGNSYHYMGKCRGLWDYLEKTELTIEKYTKDKIREVLDFERRLREEESDWGWEIDDAYIRQVEDSFEDCAFDGSVSLLAYSDGRVVGRIDSAVIASRFDGSKKAYLDWICVLKSYRHKGVAQKLMGALRRALKEEGIDTLVGLTASNGEAQSFYKSVPNSIMRDTGIWIDIS